MSYNKNDKRSNKFEPYIEARIQNDLAKDPSNESKRQMKNMMLLGGVVAVVGIGVLIAQRVKISSASQYVIKTGLGIKDISISKVAIQWPFQKAIFISVTPITFSVEVDAMSKQRIPFKMPSVWTVGPRVEPEALKNYARLMTEKGYSGVFDTLNGVIQGETRVLTANIDLNDLFADREEFKTQVVDRIDLIIRPFGLEIYNANIAELTDLDANNRYFAEQKLRALQIVNQEARVATAEANRAGEIGETKERSLARQGVAKADMEAQLVENSRRKEIEQSKRDLNISVAEFERDVNLTKIEAAAAARTREWELQKAVETLRAQQQTEKLRADQFSTANVEAEVKVRQAQAEADAIKLQADAALYAKQQEAAGIRALREADAKGLAALVNAAGNADALNRYLLVSSKLLPELAEKQALALRGLKPNVNVWQTGGNNESNNALSSTVADLFKTSIPLFDSIKQQTGYDVMGRFGLQKNLEAKEEQEPEEEQEEKK